MYIYDISTLRVKSDQVTDDPPNISVNSEQILYGSAYASLKLDLSLLILWELRSSEKESAVLSYFGAEAWTHAFAQHMILLNSDEVTFMEAIQLWLLLNKQHLFSGIQHRFTLIQIVPWRVCYTFRPVL